METEKRKYKCDGCGSNRPCYVETNQEPSYISMPIEDLRCVLDETNQSYLWVEVASAYIEVEQIKKVIANDAIRQIIEEAHMAGQTVIDGNAEKAYAVKYCNTLFDT